MTWGVGAAAVVAGLMLGGSPSPVLGPFAPAAAPTGVPIGASAAFRPPAPHGAPRDCLPESGARAGAHLELFARGRIVVVAPGIGIDARRACSGPARTRDATGVIELRPGARVTLGQLFSSWGQPLTRTRLASFRGRVRAYVAGRRVTGDPRAVRLLPHAQVVLAVGPRVPIHAAYRFRSGL